MRPLTNVPLFIDGYPNPANFHSLSSRSPVADALDSAPGLSFLYHPFGGKARTVKVYGHGVMSS